MALLGNYTVLNKSPLRFLAGSTTSTETGIRASFKKNGSIRNRLYISENTTAYKLWGEPSGTYPPNSFAMLPQKGGWISSRRESWVTITVAANGLMGMPGTGSSTFSIAFNTPDILPLDDTSPLRTATADFSITTNAPNIFPLDDTSPLRTATADFSITTNTPTGNLVVSSNGAASFEVTANNAQLTAPISGAGSATFVITLGTATLGAEASVIGSSSWGVSALATILPSDDSPVLRNALASFSISGNLTAYAIGNMSGSTDVTTELTTDSISTAVWRAVAANFNDPGTTGAKLNSASAAGDPWTAELPGTYPPGSAGDVLGNISIPTSEENATAVWNKELP